MVDDQFVALPAGRVFVRRWTQGPESGSPSGCGTASPKSAPILILHDSLGSIEIWRDFPEQLCRATGREVIAYDRLGFGQSDARVGRPALEFVAAEVPHALALLQALGVDGFVALGHSVGGGMAIELAAAAGRRCQALVTLAAQTHAEERTLEGIRAAKLQFEDARQVERLARYHGDKAQWVLDAWIGCWLDPQFRRWSVDAALARLRSPVLTIHGDQDEYGTSIHPRTIGRLAGSPARVEIMAQTGHVPQRERPELVVQMIAGFLAELAQPSA